MRGEDDAPHAVGALRPETPPHAWGRRIRLRVSKNTVRNTPTCVGKTDAGEFFGGDSQKHPHMRGEDSKTARAHAVTTETPPHAWGRPPVPFLNAVRGRNTPTCVGKTKKSTVHNSQPEKHPHMRGEDIMGLFTFANALETPPHAWGRRTPPR